MLGPKQATWQIAPKHSRTSQEAQGTPHAGTAAVSTMQLDTKPSGTLHMVRHVANGTQHGTPRVAHSAARRT